MKILNLVQGSPEWHTHRATAFNASDAPTMLGISKHKARSQFIKERATGIIQEVDDATQRRFNDGHRFESMARPLAEEIIGDELSPVTGARDEYSASFDGITYGQSVWFEHKSLNEELREVLSREGVTGADLPEEHQVQMEHQAEVCEGEKCLFMASKWDKDGNLIEELHCWYYPNPELRKRIGAGWIQFKKDVEEYKRKLAAGEIMQQKEAPQAEAIKALPAVFVQATGMVTASNLAEFREAATTFIANIKTELTTDQDFADAESTVKFCKEAEGNLEATKASVLAQMSTVDEVVRTLDHIKKQLADKRLMLDKLVKSEKESRKEAIVLKARADFNEYFSALEAEIKPIRLVAQHPDFPGAMKGLKKLSAMQDAVDTALRDGKFAAAEAVKDVREKLAWCKENAAGQSALFPDLQTLMSKPMEDFTLTITSRIEKQKADVEAQRASMEAEAKTKAEKEAAEKLEEERLRIRAEEEAKAQSDAMEKMRIEREEERKATAKAQAEALAILAAEREADAQIAESAKAPAVLSDKAVADANAARNLRPTRKELLLLLADVFDISEQTALEWILAEFAGDIQFENRKVGTKN